MPIVTTSSRKKPFQRTALVVAIVSVAIVTVITYFFFRESQSTIQPSPIVTTPNFATSSASSSLSEIQESPTASDLQDIHIDASISPTNAYVKKPGQMMLPDGRILTFKPPEKGMTKKVFVSGLVYECDSEGNFKDITPPEAFDNPFENMLVGLSIPDGKFIPGLLQGYAPNDIIAILKKEVVINPDDSEDIKLKKQAVAEMKKVILEYIDGGGTFDQFVSEMAEFAERERIIKRKGIHRILTLINEGRADEAKKFKAEIDQMLVDQEFSTITLPKPIQDALDHAN